MKKRYKKTNSGYMRRTSRIYIRAANKGKITQLKTFLILYQQMINYLIKRFWSDKNLDENLADKAFTKLVQRRFKITARLAQCVSKQAKEIVRSQKELSKRRQTLPRMKKAVANIDSRFITINEFNGHFQMALKFGSGIPKVIIPFNWTKHTNKFLLDSWELGNSIRLGNDKKKGLFIDLIFEKKRPPFKTEGRVIGIDLGFNKMMVTSDAQFIGENLKSTIINNQNKKTRYTFIDNETNRLIKELNLDDTKMIILENLKNVKKGTRGKFPRYLNRLLSFWSYSKVINKLKLLCEEKGIRIKLKSPYKTSQRCSYCGKIDKRNRKKEKFLCLNCGYEANADYNAAKNLEFLGLAGIYSFRLLEKPLEILI